MNIKNFHGHRTGCQEAEKNEDVVTLLVNSIKICFIKWSLKRRQTHENDKSKCNFLVKGNAKYAFCTRLCRVSHAMFAFWHYEYS
jgi:hypothetical protein